MAYLVVMFWNLLTQFFKISYSAPNFKLEEEWSIIYIQVRHVLVEKFTFPPGKSMKAH